MVQINGFQSPGLAFVRPAGGLAGFQRQGLNQIKKGGAGSLAVWNPADKAAAIALVNGGLTAKTAGGGSAGYSNVRATISKNAGKWYFEISSTTTNATGGQEAGLADSTVVLTSELAAQAGSATATTAGALFSGAGGPPGSIGNWSSGGVLQVVVDMTARKLWVRKLGDALWNGAGGDDPVTGVSGFLVPGANPVFPVACLFDAAAAQDCTLNCGVAGFAGAIPAGFASWG